MANMRDPERVVREWLSAVSAGALDLADPLVADTVSVIGPRGSTSGQDAVRNWIRHTRIRMAPKDIRVDGERVVVQASATWQVDGGVPGERTPQVIIGMEFTVRDGKITAIERL